ncbi:MAG: metal-dependent transcriptional regulator [Ignavibacterium sp.]|jgi:DtxR family Mn-dependent transcriptional regulator|nr:metal-dependent transcriptional regulator [Ignavibacterium sp.]
MNNVSQEDYLTAIYRNLDEAGEIKPNLLASKLEISNAAVTDMLRKLSRDGFVDYQKYKGIKLTGEGELYAKNMLRRHRMWEVFLHQTLGVPWDKVHDEAEKLEHSSSDEIINLLEEFLEYPEVDPHGYPIPDKNGKIKKSKTVVAITELNENDTAKVIRVNDDVKNLLSYVTKIGISLGKEIIVKDKLEYDGSVLMMIDRKEVNISNKIASNIFVEKIK